MEKKLDKETRKAVLKIIRELPREIFNLYFDGDNIICIIEGSDYDWTENIIYATSISTEIDNLEKDNNRLRRNNRKLLKEQKAIEKAIGLLGKLNSKK